MKGEMSFEKNSESFNVCNSIFRMLYLHILVRGKRIKSASDRKGGFWGE